MLKPVPEIGGCAYAMDYLLDESNLEKVREIITIIASYSDFIDENDTETAQNLKAEYERIKELGETEIYNALIRGDLAISN